MPDNNHHFTDSVSELLIRDLNKLKKEINEYPDEASLWIIKPGISNSAGNLAIHLTGNLLHFIGAILGKTGFVRNRHDEFNLKEVPRDEIISQIDEIMEIIPLTLKNYSDEQVTELYPIEVLGKPMSIQYFLIHLSGHLNYHLGQVNYHRRLLTQ